MSNAGSWIPHRAGAVVFALFGLVLLMAPARAAAVGVVREHGTMAEPFAARGEVPRTNAQRATLRRVGAGATWNRFGTPHSLTKPGEFLATGLSANPVTAARQFLGRNAGLYRLGPGEAAELEVVSNTRLAGSNSHVVLLSQDFGGLPAVAGGLVSVGVIKGKVVSATSALTGSSELTGQRRLVAQDAWRHAAASVRREAAAGEIGELRTTGGFARFDVEGFGGVEQQVRLAALPIPGQGARRVFEANVVDNGREPLAFTVHVDAETGKVLSRFDRLEHASDEPRWKYFDNIPFLDGADTDRRVLGCFPDVFTAPSVGAGCDVDERSTPEAAGVPPAPWDERGLVPGNTTSGNNADAALAAESPLTPGPGRAVRPASVTREYVSPFTDQWRNTKCDTQGVITGGTPTPLTGPVAGGTDNNDINAAIISLFANHNHMHDWSYNLGFTEATFNLQVQNFGKGGAGNDPELGDAQAGFADGGAPTYQGRDNANQITLQDGIAPITNMYLWQPIASAFYSPCVDGDFDMSVIGHEYTHAISNRMVGGPANGLTSGADGQARAMGESFSDLTAVEFLREYDLSPADDENPFAVGPYVTGSKQKGIRNYAMNDSPLNYSNVQGYDGSGMGSPHDDGEIWSAANFDIRQALLDKYGAGTTTQQLSCADGQTPVASCPGNRRWMQLVFDSYLLMPPDGEVSMLEARDALLAADQMRFGGANQSELWTAFARRGFGDGAGSGNPADAGSFGDTDDPDPVASFSSPLRTDETTLTFKPTASEQAGSPGIEAELFVGDYEANVTPVADTDPGTPVSEKVDLLPGTYQFVTRADGYGMHKFTRTIAGGEDLDLTVGMPTNRASKNNGATTSGDADSVNTDMLVDDTEETDWASVNRMPNAAGAQVTVKLAGGAQLVERANVSALLRGPDDGDDQDDPGSQNRFSALRQFKLLSCNGADDACDEDSEYSEIYTSSPNAFPGDVPRPLAPDMNLRSFPDVQDTTATHLRLVTVTNQCLGNPTFMDNTLDNDPASNSDCRIGNPPLLPRSDRTVRAAELQVFSRAAEVTVTQSPRPASGNGQAGAPSYGLPADQICAEIAAFRSVSVRPRGRGARIAFARRRNTPVNIDVFQQSRGERITGNRRVASFRGRRRSFTWRGRGLGGRRLPSGRYAVRFRVPRGAGRLDIRHVALERKRARFRRRPNFSATGSCGLLNVYRLSGSTFSATRRPLAALFRVRRRSTVSVVVRRRGRVVRRLRARSFAAGRPFRLNIRSSRLRRGDYRVTITARSGSERVTRTLVSRRL